MTDAETLFMKELRNRRLKGYEFRRQHPIAGFITDFFCLESKHVVELDGDYHNDQQQRQYDEGRTHELAELKIRVIRFTNREVLENLDQVLDQILKHLESRRLPSPSGLPAEIK